MFQVFLIIFWATIRLQGWGDAVCDPSVGNPSGSQANHLPLTGEAMTIPLVGEPRAVACGAVLFASPAKGRWGRRKAHGSVGSRFLQQLRFATPPVRKRTTSPWQGRQPLSQRS